MSFACRSNGASGANGANGFTLLEVLFVLFVGGLMIALVGPRIGGRLDAYERHYRFQAIEDGLRQLPRRARLMGKSLELPRDLGLSDLGDGRPPLALPSGWQLKVVPGLRISSLGACSGARLSVVPENADAFRNYEITEPGCELERQEGERL